MKMATSRTEMQLNIKSQNTYREKKKSRTQYLHDKTGKEKKN